MWCSAWRALEGEGSEGKDKGLVRRRKMWQGTLCSYWSTALSEQGSAGTGLCIYAVPSFCSKPHLPTSQHAGMDVTKGETDRVSFTQSVVSVCAPLEATSTHTPSYVEDWRTGYLCVHFLYFQNISCSADSPCLLHEPGELWDTDLAWWALSLTSTGAVASPSPCHKISSSLRSPAPPAQKVHVCSP